MKHSVCYWCFRAFYTLPEFCKEVKALGFESVEILGPADWKVVKDAGLTCAVGMDSFCNISKGFNDPKNHAFLQVNYVKFIRQASENGIPSVICFSGNRNGISDAQGLENCARGLEMVTKEAEKYGVKIVIELLNSYIDHADYQCDHTAWGASLVQKLGSPNFKLLYDIYHAQVMEGNICNNIIKYHEVIGHYHTAGLPGRNEIDDSQEINYPFIIKTIKDTGYDGFLGQEFIPTSGKPLESLRKAKEICTV